MAGDPDRIRHNIGRFSFDHCTHGSQGFSRILIQMFGFAGHGKSAFINSCMYVWEDGSYKNSTSSADNYGGQTLERRSYPLTETITLVDNRGFGIIGGYESGEIFAQLGNLLPLDEPVKWTKKYELINKINEAKDSVRVSDFVVPVLVYSITKSVTPEEEGELKAVLQISQTLTGIFPFVVLTNKTHGELTKREATFRSMGVNKIFSIENYTPEDHSKLRGKHEVVLKFLHEVVKEVQIQAEKPRNPEREMRRRRRYVKMYVKEREKIYREEASIKRKLQEQYKKPNMKNDPQMDLDHERQREKLLEEDIRRMQEMMSCVDVEEEPIYLRPIDVMGGILP
ncbi:uncharacterized protein LOC122945832 [Bufo gargarizans]|uniref:uncharacterized protein LOC122945832 n=1 Tax=Bufo gargarizans TaxID=30331 RepID=UPI001CF4CC03|nr:uncharacterized protein LOC122945832 [Bufo gargarizans]